MASLELFESTEQSLETLNEICQQVSCNPLFKAVEIHTLLLMVESLKRLLDRITPNYYSADEEYLANFKAGIDKLTIHVKTLIHLKKEKFS
jgi:hypothetical protein